LTCKCVWLLYTFPLQTCDDLVTDISLGSEVTKLDPPKDHSLYQRNQQQFWVHPTHIIIKHWSFLSFLSDRFCNFTFFLFVFLLSMWIGCFFSQFSIFLFISLSLLCYAGNKKCYISSCKTWYSGISDCWDSGAHDLFWPRLKFH
jgi:hypothetical protein